VDSLSRQLTLQYGRGFSRVNLFGMVRFAEVFSDPKIVQTLSEQLGWSHFVGGGGGPIRTASLTSPQSGRLH